MPPLSAGSGNPPPLAPPNGSFEHGKGASEGSDATTSNTLTNGGPSEAVAGQPRKRKLGGILGRSSHAKNKEKELERRESRQSRRGKHKFTFMGQARALLGSPINLLLFAAPVGIALHFAKASPIAVFVTNFIAIIPLAALLSYCTEEIALRTGETIGGLLNATFG
jgi:Ca2+:H+ antiporter